MAKKKRSVRTPDGLVLSTIMSRQGCRLASCVFCGAEAEYSYAPVIGFTRDDDRVVGFGIAACQHCITVLKLVTVSPCVISGPEDIICACGLEKDMTDSLPSPKKAVRLAEELLRGNRES